jgi:DNA primase
MDIKEQVLIDALNKSRAKRKNNTTQTGTQIPKTHDYTKGYPTTDYTKNNATADDTLGNATTEYPNFTTPAQAQEQDYMHPPIDEQIPQYDQLIQHNIHEEVSPFKPLEEALIRFVVKAGEKVLFDYVDDNGERIIGRVAQYIQSELVEDDIQLQTTVFQLILNEAVQYCNDDNFKTLRYFLAHPDPYINQTAVQLVSDKYLFFDDEDLTDDQTLIDVDQTITYNNEEERQKHEEEQKRLIQQQLEAFLNEINREIFALKAAHVGKHIETIKFKIKGLQKEDKMDEVMQLMKELTQLNQIKVALGKQLGERIILKM